MKNKLVSKLTGVFCAGMLSIALVTPTHAALIDRGNGLIYDDILDITWLQDASFSAGSAFDDGANAIDGRMTWDSAIAWADQLVYEGFDDWRLPTAFNQDGSGPCDGFDCDNSEMGHMYYNNLGAQSGDSVSGNQLSVDGISLINIQTLYWTSTEAPLDSAWIFDFGFVGSQFHGFDLISNFSAWAVRPGDVVAVPEPATTLILALGLFGLMLSMKDRRLLK